MVRVAGDIALVVGDDGVIHSVAEGTVPLPAGGQHWVGRPWVDTVDAAARQKVELLLQEAQTHGVSRPGRRAAVGVQGHSYRSSMVLGQLALSSRLSARSASSLPPVWQRAQ